MQEVGKIAAGSHAPCGSNYLVLTPSNSHFPKQIHALLYFSSTGFNPLVIRIGKRKARKEREKVSREKSYFYVQRLRSGQKVSSGLKTSVGSPSNCWALSGMSRTMATRGVTAFKV